MECYLKHINNSKFRVALSKLRTTSHSLEIERGRNTRPKLNVDQRLCMSCNVVEDEEHFVLHCQDNRVERELLFQKIYMRDSSFFNLSSSEQFVFLMRCSDPQIMAWFGKFIHHSCLNRNILRYNVRTRWGQGVVFLWPSRHWRQCLVTCGAVSEGRGCRFLTIFCSRMYVSLDLCSNMLLIKCYVDYLFYYFKHFLVLLFLIICIFVVSLPFCNIFMCSHVLFIMLCFICLYMF